jgi:hypothetical protein
LKRHIQPSRLSQPLLSIRHIMCCQVIIPLLLLVYLRGRSHGSTCALRLQVGMRPNRLYYSLQCLQHSCWPTCGKHAAADPCIITLLMLLLLQVRIGRCTVQLSYA